jgi:hypothetical protein
MTVYLLFVFAIAVSLAIIKLFALAWLPDKVPAKGYVVVSIIFWLAFAGWTAYLVLNV